MGSIVDGQTYSTTIDGVRQYWKVDLLWKLAKSLPVEHIPIEALISQLQGTCWTDEDDDVTPNWVLGHTRRIMGADLSYPILIDKTGNIMDGLHRLCKAILEGREVIIAQRFEALPDPSFMMNVQDSDTEYWWDEFPLFV